MDTLVEGETRYQHPGCIAQIYVVEIVRIDVSRHRATMICYP